MRRRELGELKNLNFGGYSHRVNQSGACSSSDVITSGGRKSETTMEDKVIVVVCGYPELYILGVDRYVFFRADTDTDYYRSSRPITDILNRYTCLV